MPPIRTIDVHGTPYEMGIQHGQQVLADVRKLAHQRLLHCQDTSWSETVLPADRIMRLTEACLPAHAAYAPRVFDELTGISAATGVGLAELLIVNGFTDLVDVINNAQPGLTTTPGTHANCTTFAVAPHQTVSGKGLIGQTWDMHWDTLPYVVLLRGHPQDAPAFLTFTLTGCVGMIGLNEAGIAVCINDLNGAFGREGVTWPFVVREILRQTTLDDALRCITQAQLAGAHNYLIMDAHGTGCNVEAMVGFQKITPLATYLAHTNRCLDAETHRYERVLSPEGTQNSEARYRRACAYLEQPPFSVASLMELTRDRSDGIDGICALHPDWQLQTVGAVIMCPAAREFWCVWGLPTEHEYEKFSL